LSESVATLYNASLSSTGILAFIGLFQTDHDILFLIATRLPSNLITMSKPSNQQDATDTLISRTQIKQEMEALQKIGMRLTALNPDQLAQVPMDETLAGAVHEYQRLKKNEAKRRQGQYIGRIMRNSDPEAIINALNEFDASQRQHVQHFHVLEQWRERLIDEPQALTEFFDAYPEADKLKLKQLIAKTIKERKQAKNSGAKRKLFHLIRSTIETARLSNDAASE
jgi:ribosome-associated protein